jgi:Holliday junction resolvase RusA-like endonuclease
VPQFEFVIQGPPGATVNTKNARRYQKWVGTVREAARRAWPADRTMLRVELVVEVTNYFRIVPERPHPPDVDNVLKPILDGMKTVVYAEDDVVRRVVSDRFGLAQGLPTTPPILADALVRFREVLFIRVTWEDDGD